MSSFGKATVKRVVRSTLAAEAYGISEGIETAQWVRHEMAEILYPDTSLADIEKHSVKRIIHAVADETPRTSPTTSTTMPALQPTRLRIVVAMLREAFSLAENVYLTWIPTWRILADALTKLVSVSMLRALLSGQRFTASPPVKCEPASAKMPTRAPSALAGQVVKTLVTSSLPGEPLMTKMWLKSCGEINHIFVVNFGQILFY